MPREPKRPNILVIVVHDIGTFLGCYGHSWLRTPRLDALAGDGVRLTRHFATAPFCSPARSSLWTGTYPHVNGLMGLVNLGWDLPKGTPTLAEVLGIAGYETLLFGFQHEAKDAARLGFNRVTAPPRASSAASVAPLAVSFLHERGRGAGAPFYARVGFTDCHRAWPVAGDDGSDVEVPAFLADTPDVRQDLANFRASLAAMDASVGRILDALDDCGLRDNTAVVFTTDHGAPFPRAKGTLYDPGINTAMIVRWPDGFAGGRVYDELISGVDLFPTLLEAAGSRPPKDIQGRSFLPLLQDREYKPRDAIFAEMNTLPGCIRRCVRTAQHKYIENVTPQPRLFLPTDIETSLSRKHMGNDHLRPAPPAELYELRDDPDELRNLADDPQHAAVGNQLKSLLRRMQEETNDPALAGRIERPADETARLRGAFAASLARCEYPRAGLKTGFDAMDESGD